MGNNSFNSRFKAPRIDFKADENKIGTSGSRLVNGGLTARLCLILDFGVFMKNNEAAQFSIMLTHIASLYGKEIDSTIIEIYWQSLKEFDFNCVKESLISHIKNIDVGQFMPKPADIIRSINGSSKSQSLMAWSKVLNAINAVGVYETIVFDDEIIHSVIEDMGGWVDICSTLIKDMPFKKNEFCNRYSHFISNPADSYPAKLEGLTEKNNSFNGFYGFDLKLSFFGNEEKARNVYMNGGDDKNINIKQIQFVDIVRLKNYQKNENK